MDNYNLNLEESNNINFNRVRTNRNPMYNQVLEDYFNYTNNIQTINIEEFADRTIAVFNELRRNHTQEELSREGFLEEFNNRLSNQRFWRRISQEEFHQIAIIILRNRNTVRNPIDNILSNNTRRVNSLRNRFNNFINETVNRFINGINRIRNFFRIRNNNQTTINITRLENESIVGQRNLIENSNNINIHNNQIKDDKKLENLIRITENLDEKVNNIIKPRKY